MNMTEIGEHDRKIDNNEHSGRQQANKQKNQVRMNMTKNKVFYKLHLQVKHLTSCGVSAIIWRSFV